MERTTVFFLPFAGASKYNYLPFIKTAPENLNVIALELPGRGARRNENPLLHCEDAVEDLVSQISDHTQAPYMIFGHSMGAMLGHQVMHQLIKYKLPLPYHFFVSGCQAPSIPVPREPLHLLPSTEFVNKLREFGGTPREVLENQSLMTFFEPTLRADFQVLWTRNRSIQPPLNVPFTVLWPNNDFPMADALEWERETVSHFEFHTFDGNHFFIFDYVQAILDLISQTAKSS